LGCAPREIRLEADQSPASLQPQRRLTNQAEGFLARLRRMIVGQHHHVSPQYLYQFTNEAAWKEDHRRLSNGELSYKKLALAMAHPVSRNWAGYWQEAN